MPERAHHGLWRGWGPESRWAPPSPHRAAICQLAFMQLSGSGSWIMIRIMHGFPRKPSRKPVRARESQRTLLETVRELTKLY